MKTYELKLVFTTDNLEIVEDLKSMINCGKFQRDLKKDKSVSKVIATFKEIR